MDFGPLSLITAIAPNPGGEASATIVSFQVLKFSRIENKDKLYTSKKPPPE